MTKSADLALSAGQTDIWFDEKLSGGSLAYNTAGYLDIRGPLDAELFREAARQLTDEAECTRSRFLEGEGRPRQSIQPLAELPYKVLDFSGDSDPLGAARDWMLADLDTPFTLTDFPLFRLALLRTGADRSYFYMCIHHFLCDGYSQVVFWRRLSEIYGALVAGRTGDEGRLPPLSALLDAEQAYTASPQAARDAAFWAARFPVPPAPVSLSESDSEPGQGFVREEFSLSQELTGALRDLARRASVTWPTVVMAAIGAYTQRSTGRRDVLLTVPVTTRVGALMRAVPGMVANTLPLHLRVSPATTRQELLKQTSREFTRVLKHQRHRVSRIRGAMGLRSDDRRPFGPLVNILPQDTRMTLGPCDVTVNNLSTGLIDDFEITVVDSADGGSTLHLSGNSGLYTQAELSGHADRLARFVEAFVAAADDTPLGRLAAMAGPALARTLAAGTGPVRTAPFEGVVERVRRTADTYPGGVAVIDDSGEITYSSLVRRAGALSRRLDAGTAAVLAAPGIGFVTAVLGALNAGGSYLPLDPGAPADRLVALLRDSGARLLVTDPAHRDSAARIAELAGPGIRLVLLDDSEDPADALAEPRGGGQDLAYTIFTSGSTGRPKGAMVHRAGMVNHLLAKVEDLDLCESDTLVQNAPVTFDISVWQMLAPLLVGGRVRVVGRAVAADPELLFPLTADEDVTVLEVVPSLLRAALDSWDACGQYPPLPSLRWLMVTGEALPADLCTRWSARFPRIPLINAYGPTECSDDVTHAVITSDGPPAGRTTAPIGRTVRNTRLVVLSDELQPLPAGTAGELYVAGDGVGRGYLGDPARTAAVFVPDPYGPPGTRMYRTGDRVVLHPDGQFEFLERRDHQVKVRGHRIELGEIEAALRELPQLADAAVAVHQDTAGRKRLTGYLVPRGGGEADTGRVRELLGRKLPGYMVPAEFLTLDALPLTAHGKVDRKALPAPEHVAPEASGEAPRGRAEEILTAAMAETLGRVSVGPDDNFFELGGDSINAIQVVGLARRAGLAISARDVFERRTPASLAAIAGPLREQPAAAPDDGIGESELLPIAHQLRDSLGTAEGPVREYSQYVAVEVPAGAGQERLTAALQAVIDHHDALRLRLTVPVPGVWTLEVRPVGTVDAAGILTRVAAADGPLAGQITEQVAAARALLAPEDGTVLRAVHIDAGPDLPGRLVLVAHHLAVDGVSWRILVPDLKAAHEALEAGATVALDPVPTSLRRWSRELSEHARSARRVSELPIWTSQLTGTDPLLGDRLPDPAKDVQSTARRLRTELPADRTAELLTAVPAAVHADINDIMLTALALATADWRRNRGAEGSELLVEIEGHGREEFAEGLDLTRTAGWFTSTFPVRLTPGEIDWSDVWSGGPSTGAALKRIKEQLRELPDQGIGFGLLRHLNPQTQGALARFATPQIGFNYLGRFGGSGAGGSWSLDGSDAVVGLGAHPLTPLRHVVELSAVTEERSGGPVLVAEWAWAGELLDQRDVSELARGWFRALEALIGYARTAGDGGRTPSDFPLVQLSQQEIEGFERDLGPLADVLPASPLQQGLLFSAEFDAEGLDPYTLQIGVDTQGPLDTAVLRASAEALLRRHDNLRACFPDRTGGDPVQVIPATAAVGWREIDLTGLTGPERDAELARVSEAEWRGRFDIRRSPLVRFTVVRIDDTGPVRHRLLWSVHHALVDGWSMAIFAQELFTLYARGAAPDALPEVTPYRGYVDWLSARDDEAARTAWKAVLSGIEEPTRLVQSGRSAELSLPDELVVEVDEELTAALGTWAGARGLTVNTVMQGAWAVLLGRLTGRRDVVFGAVNSGRPADLAGVESIVGSFLNTLPVRVCLRPDRTLPEVLAELQEQQFAMAEHQHLGLAEVQQIAGVGELFDTVLSYNNYPMSDVGALAGLVPGLSFGGGHAKVVAEYPFALSVYPGARMQLHTQYAPGSLTRAEAESVTGRLVRLLHRIVEGPDTPLGRLDVLEPDERRTLLGDWAGEVTAAPRTPVTALFEDWAARTPDAPAVLFDGAEITYREVNARANRLARLLIDRGVGPEQLVALALPRTPEMVIAALGVLKTGAGYLPIDAGYPPERIAYMLADSRPVALLTTAEPALDLDVPDTPVVVLDNGSTTRALAGYPDTDVRDEERTTPLLAQHAAYTIYTSGSTGQPKGVLVDHAGFAAMIVSLTERFGLDNSVRVLQFASFSFDASAWELGLALFNGGAVVVADDECRDPGQPLVDLINDCGVTLAGLPPVVAGALPEGTVLPAGLTIAVAGEACPPEVVARWAPHVRLFNGYGPTEAVVASTVGGPLSATGRPPIGRPTAAHRVYVLDRDLRPVPQGVIGELYVAGGLARGYLNRAGLTAQRFLADPYGTPGTRMYRTGDLVRWLPEGRLDYVGRSDDQVQLRGFRIELGEIESVLAAHPEVAAAVVMVREDAPGDKRVIAYLLPDGDDAAGPSAGPSELAAAVREHAANALPQHMVPSAFLVLDALPLTSAGKVDRKALPAPESAGRTEGRAPRTPVEEILCGLFADVLGLDRIGVDEDFFASGGHSLLATRVVSRARSLLGVELPIRTLFEARTVAGLAERVAVAAEARPAPRLAPRTGGVGDGVSPLSWAQQRLWFANRLEQGRRGTYNVPFAIRLTGELDLQALQSALNDLVGRHEVLRSLFPAVDDVAYQRVMDAPAGDPVLVARRVSAAGLDQALTEEAETGFDLTAAPPLRARLFALEESDDTYVLLLVFHHIAFDGWSIAPLVHDLTVGYRARAAGREPQWTPLPVQYADYAVWQRLLLGSADDPDSMLSGQLAYWTGHLDGLPDELRLPRDFRRPAVATHDGGTVEFTLDAELYAELGGVARQSGATLFMVLQAAFAALLTRLGSGTDIVLGSPIAGRTDEGLADLIGTFINTLVLRTDTSGDPAFHELVDRVREVNLSAYANQDVPFDQIVEALNPARSLARHPLFQVMLVMQNTDDAAPAALPGLDLTMQPVPQRMTKFDLRLQFDESDDPGARLRGVLEYATDLFTRSTATVLVGHLQQVLRAVAADPGARISTIDLLEGKERRLVLTEGNHTDHEAATGTLPELFEAAARRTPDAPALVADGATLTYRELDARSNRLARHLLALGAGPERIVGISLPRSPDLVVALLATVKSGAAYTLFEPTLPAGRVESLAGQARPVALVTTPASATRMPPGHPRVLLGSPALDTVLDELPDTPLVSAERGDPAPADPACVVYASDADGRLLGTVVEHRSLAAQVSWAAGDEASAGARTLPSALTFAGTVSEVFGPLAAGGSVLLDEPAEQRHLSVVDGGFTIEPDDRVPAGILAGGRPGAHTHAYVLDEKLAPVPVGAFGELHLAGGLLARGYLGRPGQTAERFVADPYGPAGSRMFRTGETMRWTEDGVLVPADPTAVRPEVTAPDRAPAAPARRAPRTRHEDVLCGVLAEALGRDTIGIDDNFFDTGMDSIRSMRVVSGARKAGIDISIADVFAHQTVAALAAEVDRKEGPVRQDPPRGSVIDEVFSALGSPDEHDPFATVVPLKPTGTRPPLFCLHSGVGFALPYVGLARHIGDDHPIYGIQAPSITELAPLPGSVREMAAQYAALIKEVRPQGPYHLLGWSFGGSLAYEIAVELQRGGDEVGLVADLDSYPRTKDDEVGDDQSLLGWVVELVGHDKSEFAGRELTPADVVGVLRRGNSPMAALGEERVLAMLATMRNNGRLLSEYEPRAFEGKLDLFVATANLSDPEIADRVGQWTPHVKDARVAVHQVPCSHDYMMHPDPLALVGAAVAAELRRLHMTAALAAGGTS
ncbi:amino acid adenylation domain-containing protein [Streptomyces sp. C11-1]|uniref:Amino acid adenylation domain-containing protein n=1 Tax=Streptomyces durocortorensis TaxID=2811104 RepID=A0ABY9VW39_9ACTN|nr:non-ribosomal peptide synthetase [Streptomyces durocortorensis]WNF28008.1 amino acid adenylation domain-containing protein [Streptomyces durocortorensis]